MDIAARTERAAPYVRPASDLFSVASTSAWFDRFYQVEVEDALERFARLRRKGPVVHGWGMDFGEFVVPDIWGWHNAPTAMVMTYRGARKVLRSQDLFSHSLYAKELGDENPLFQDGPEHLRFRKVVMQVFNQQAVKEWTETAVHIAHRLIDDFVASGQGDLIPQYCRQLPGRVFGRFIGADEKDFEKLAALAIRMMNARDEQGLEAVRILAPFFADLIADRRALSHKALAQRHDLVSLLCRAELDGRRFSDTEINTVLHVLVIGGTDTVYKGLAATLYYLLTQRGLLGRVARNRNLIAPLIEESVRLASPNVWGASRLATSDVEIEGIEVVKGTAVLINIAMANRDPAQWDNPWTFDVDRTETSTMAWGTGVHMCLGMHLARVVMNQGTNMLLDRCPNIRLDRNKPEPRLVGLGTLYSPALPVCFDSPAIE